MIREEVNQLSDKLAELGAILSDDKPNKEQVTEIVTTVFGIVTEGVDFAQVPKEERVKAIIHAFIQAGGKIADSAISYTDDPV